MPNGLVVGLVLLLVGGGIYLKSRSDRKKDNEDSSSVDQVAIPQVPKGRWIYGDECSTFSNGNIIGDSNGAGDLVSTLALNMSVSGTAPLFVGVVRTDDGLDDTHTRQIIESLEMDIPVYTGALEFRGGDSALAQAIITESNKGKVNVVWGAPAQDLMWALKNGANASNITLYALLYNTSNGDGSATRDEEIKASLTASTDYVYEQLEGRIYDVQRPDYYHLIQTKFSDYINLLYIVDVSEQKVKTLDGSDLLKLSEEVTFLILQREWQKVWYKNSHR